MIHVPRILMASLLVLTALPAMAGPDLTASVEIQKGSIDEETGMVPVTYYVSVSNIGDAACPAGGFFADFWPEFTCPTCNPASGCGELLSWEPGEIPELLPGGEPHVLIVERDIEPNVLPYRYLFYVDSVFNFCPEDNEDNNIACAEYDVSPVAGNADLALSDCLVEPSLDDASMMDFSVSVTNVGVAPTEGTVNVEFYLQKLGDTYDDHVGEFGDKFALLAAGLEPGASQVLSATIPCPPNAYEGACAVNVFDEVEEPDYQNNIALSEPYQCVEMANNPDLEALTFSASLQGNTPVFEGTFGNNGTVDIEPEEQFKIGIWFNAPGGPDINVCPDVEAGEGWIIAYNEGVPKGETGEFAWGATPLQNGFYESWVVLDCDNEIFEMDEKNNRATSDLLVDSEGPDLRIKDAGYELHEENKGFHVEYTLWVENAGSLPVDGFYVDIFWDAEHPPTWQEAGDYKGAFEEFEETLEPGGVRQITLVWSPVDGVPQGLYSTWVVLDITNEVSETVESNNTHQMDVEVPEYIDGLPNLGIELFTVKPTGDTAHFYANVCNTGVKPVTTPFRLDIFTDQEGQPIMGDLGDLTQDVDGLEVGECAVFSQDLEDLKDGEYRAYLVVDTDNRIEEAVEGDNMAGPRIYVICSSCDACPEGVYVTEPDGCYCGGATVNYGFCCDGEWYAVGCPAAPVEGEGDVVAVETYVVEFGNGGFGGPPGGGCGCQSVANTQQAPLSLWLLVLLFAALFVPIRRSLCDRMSQS